MKKNILIAVFSLFTLHIAVFGQDYNEYLNFGLDAYSRSDWSSAIFSFQKADTLSGSQKPEALYWLVMANASAKNYKSALSYADKFLKKFPNSPKRPEIVYQQGRLYCLCAEHEKSIQILYGFLRKYSSHRQVPSAYYWIGENLYMAGRLQDARVIFSRIILDYPTSAKAAPSRYKIALIDQASTQEELLNLLKISHEELLKISEEYDKNKKSYEQTVAVYQKQLGEVNRDTRIAELAEKLQLERKKNVELYDKMVMLELKNQELLAALSTKDPVYLDSFVKEEEEAKELEEDIDTSEQDKRKAALEKLRAKAELLENMLLESMYEQLLEGNDEKQ